MNTTKRQHCGWHFRYRHPDIAGNCLARVFTDNTNPLKIKKEQNWTVPGKASLFIDRIHPMQGEQTTNALRAVNIAKASEETGNRFTRRYQETRDTILYYPQATPYAMR
ncbi:hypothetical protein T12_13651 [Trichinella patagoniensis]|uniref:Uncharacterized protein n=1 Tax=Trichinella patagoniensis TaxID=990121 RepID=A0A0V0Z4A3_9BILA|nr:hypothetical protein T12_13651 [Trichinella patagoniensis]